MNQAKKKNRSLQLCLFILACTFFLAGYLAVPCWAQQNSNGLQFASIEPQDHPALPRAASPNGRPNLPHKDLSLELAQLINLVRAHYGLPPLRLSKTLNRAALEHSKDMATNNFVSHTGSEGSSPWRRMKRVGYPVFKYGENVAAGILDPKQVVKAWLNSPSHRKVLLNPHYKEMGIGFVFNPQSPHRFYWTLDLALSRPYDRPNPGRMFGMLNRY